MPSMWLFDAWKDKKTYGWFILSEMWLANLETDYVSVIQSPAYDICEIRVAS